MSDWARIVMEDQGPSPDGLGQDYWMAPQLPYAVRHRIEIVFEVLSHLPLEQPVVVVSDVGKTMALNAPLVRLVGGPSDDLLGRQWSSVMPGWPDRARSFRREGEQVFEEHLGRPGGERIWRVSRWGRSPREASPGRWPTYCSSAGRMWRPSITRRSAACARACAAGRHADRLCRRGRPRRRHVVREPVLLSRRRRDGEGARGA